ncbi:MAG: M20 family metallopeptidase [Planctomycetes bacterium]|nr:M20 family metallopeptidase [Planctomycetota bacterium]
MSARAPVDVVALLSRLLAIPSISKHEAEKVAFLAAFFRERGAAPVVEGRNLLVARGHGPQALLLNTHTDTVPDSPSWTRQPFSGEIAEGRVHGLGATDAQGCLAAMCAAFLGAAFDEARGRLLLAATCDEETGGEGLEKFIGEIRQRHGLPAAVVVGEPTDLAICVGQRGLLRLVTRARGRACHASRPHEGENALLAAARDALAGEEVAAALPGEHPLLGRTTVVPTMISGGVKANVVPDLVEITWDVRTIPNYGNDRTLEVFRSKVRSEVIVKSSRFHPIVTDPVADIVVAAREALGTPVRGFGGISDLFWARESPGVIVGPGKPEQSHTADEFILVDDLTAGASAYRRLIERFFDHG